MTHTTPPTTTGHQSHHTARHDDGRVRGDGERLFFRGPSVRCKLPAQHALWFPCASCRPMIVGEGVEHTFCDTANTLASTLVEAAACEARLKRERARERDMWSVGPVSKSIWCDVISCSGGRSTAHALSQSSRRRRATGSRTLTPFTDASLHRTQQVGGQVAQTGPHQPGCSVSCSVFADFVLPPPRSQRAV
jgi:hypothetical protein